MYSGIKLPLPRAIRGWKRCVPYGFKRQPERPEGVSRRGMYRFEIGKNLGREAAHSESMVEVNYDASITLLCAMFSEKELAG
jgi:hypothetical protein